MLVDCSRGAWPIPGRGNESRRVLAYGTRYFAPARINQWPGLSFYIRARDPTDCLAGDVGNGDAVRVRCISDAVGVLHGSLCLTHVCNPLVTRSNIVEADHSHILSCRFLESQLGNPKLQNNTAAALRCPFLSH